MIRLIRLVSICAFLFAVHPGLSLADDNDMEGDDYSYGEVVTASDQELSVLEYDYEMDVERTVVYKVDANTALTNIKKVAELVKGETVEVYFKEKEGGVRTAEMVIKDDTANPVDDQTPAP
jgi:hypothetical protein